RRLDQLMGGVFDGATWDFFIHNTSDKCVCTRDVYPASGQCGFDGGLYSAWM
ncbi:hypothetical protein V5799_017815, partial [Amblyomma americanum]